MLQVPSLLAIFLFFSTTYISPTTSKSSFPKSCCMDQNDKPYLSCTCLVDNQLQTNYHLKKNKIHYFHWRLTDLKLANTPDQHRASVKIHTLSCWGQMVTYIKGFALDFPTKESAWYAHNGTNGHGYLKFPFVHANYLISIQSKQGGNFSIVASTKPNLIPIPGQNGNVVVNQISQNSIEVLWAGADSLNLIKYELYYNLFQNHNRIQNVSLTRQKICQERGTTMGPCADERAIMNTPCGCRRNGILATTILQSEFEKENSNGNGFENENSNSNENGNENGNENSNEKSNMEQKDKTDDVVRTPSSSFSNDRNILPENQIPMYRAVINDLPLGIPIFVNVLAVPIDDQQYEIAYKGSSVSLSFDRVVSVFEGAMVHVYIASAVYGIAGVLFLVAVVQKFRIHNVVSIGKRAEKLDKEMKMKNVGSNVVT